MRLDYVLKIRTIANTNGRAYVIGRRERRIDTLSSYNFCVWTLIWHLKLQISQFMIANLMRQFVITSNDHKCMWSWKCLYRPHIAYSSHHPRSLSRTQMIGIFIAGHSKGPPKLRDEKFLSFGCIRSCHIDVGCPKHKVTHHPMWHLPISQKGVICQNIYFYARVP
jgi:hypothetical protein